MAWAKVNTKYPGFPRFANFYWQFIKSFSKIAAPLMSMLKTTVSWQVLIANIVFVTKKVLIADKVHGVESVNELNEIYGKLSKTRKLSKSQKLAKSRKKLFKSGNLSNFNAKKNEPSFLTPDARMTFNYLWLAFTKILILRHFDPECHIRIETDALGYAISGVLNQLASETRPDGIITKTDLSQ